MNGRRSFVAGLLGLGLSLGRAGPVSAQGFAGLGTAREGYAVPRPGPFTFPADHGAHPEFRIEWWYVTANLASGDGTQYGVQWTLFRSALAPPEAAQGLTGWSTPQAYLAHAALTTAHRHFTAERLGRGGVGQAGVTAQPFAAWIDDWQLAGPDLDTLSMTARDAEFGYDLALRARGPLVPQGDGGYSVKSASGQASRYYSQPFYAVTGTLLLPEGDVDVTGQAWLDREWSSQPLSEGQTGWDWFSLHFADGAKLMAFRLRDARQGDYSAATWIAADGTPGPLPDGAVQFSPLTSSRVAGRDIPTRWRLRLPARGVDVTVDALNPASWMDVTFPYWEGPVTVSGSHVGRGYLEMTGYE